MSLLITLLITSINTPIEFLFPTHGEFFSFSVCAFAETPLYLRDNKEWHKANRSNYTASASGDRSEHITIRGSGSTLRESFAHLTIQQGDKHVSDTEKRNPDEGIHRHFATRCQSNSSHGDGSRSSNSTFTIYDRKGLRCIG